MLAVFVLSLVGCSSADPSGPSALRESPDATLTWRGTVVGGDRPAEAIPLLERAWVQRVQPRSGSAGLQGWEIVMHEGPLFEPGALCGTARCGDTPLTGLTYHDRRRIELSWTAGARLVAVMAWELCNAQRRDGDKGCQ